MDSTSSLSSFSICIAEEKISVLGQLWDRNTLPTVISKTTETFSNNVKLLKTFYEKLEECIDKLQPKEEWNSAKKLINRYEWIRLCFKRLLEIEEIAPSQKLINISSEKNKLCELSRKLATETNKEGISNQIDDLYINYLEILIEEQHDNSRYFLCEIQLFLKKKTIDSGKLAFSPKGYSFFHYAAQMGDFSYINSFKNELKNQKILNTWINTRSNTSLQLSPLEQAIAFKNWEFAKQLIEMGADVNDCTEIGQCTPLRRAIASDYSHKLECIKFLLENKANPLIEECDFKNCLHCAAIVEEEEVIEILLQDERANQNINKEDVFGFTALDYVIRLGNDRCIKLLIGKDFTGPYSDLPGYGEGLIPIDQTTIIKRIKHYLDLKNKEELDPLEKEKSNLSTMDFYQRKNLIRNNNLEDLGIKEGACNGFSFLKPYYTFNKLKSEFFTVLRMFSKWDGEATTLQIPLKDKLSGNYQTLEELLEQWINDIVWPQQSYDGATWTKQSARVNQFNCVKKRENSQLNVIFDPTSFSLNIEQLHEMLTIFSYFPHLYLDIGGEKHDISADILPDHKICFYDPNLQFETKPLNSIETAKIIQNYKYRGFGKNWKRMNIEIGAYQFLNREEKNVDLSLVKMKVPQQFLEKQSLCGFTPFHFAIIFNDEELFEEEIKKENCPLNTSVTIDCSTPLHLSMLWNRRNFVEQIVKNENFDWSTREYEYVWSGLRNAGYLDLYKEALKNEKTHFSKIELTNLVEEGNIECINLFFSIPERKKYVNKTICDTPLMCAIRMQNFELIRCLVGHGADFLAKGMVGNALEMVASKHYELFRQEFVTEFVHYLTEANLIDVKEKLL